MRNDGPFHRRENGGIDGARRHAGRHIAVQHLNLQGMQIRSRIGVGWAIHTKALL